MDYFAPPEGTATERFVIRTYRPGDGEAISAAVNVSYDHLKTFMPWAKPVQTVEQSERYARECYGRWLLAQDFALGIWSPDERTLLGGSGFHLRGGGLQLGNAEIGMWIRADRAHRGLGTAALRELVRWGFTEWPWQRLSWHCSTRNTASARVAEKAGFQLDGTLRQNGVDADGVRRDTMIWSRLR